MTLRTALLRSRLAALVSLSVLAAVPASTAGAASPALGVTGADLPQTVRADNIFGYLEGGSRTLSRGIGLDYPDASCIFYSSGYRAASVRFAAYTLPGGERPYFSGLQDPTFVVYEFANPARARKGYLRIVDYAQRCAGRSTEETSSRTLRRVAVPSLGERQIGFRVKAADDTTTNEDLEIYVLRGNRIERSWIQSTGGASRTKAVRMARLLADTAR